MIINTKEMLEKAKENKYAVPHFNINNLEWTRYILEECEKQKTPVIIGISEGALKYMGGYNTVVGIVKNLVHDLNITIPVAIHLDHGSSVDVCKNCIDAGFTSVMIDASKYDLETNIKMVKEVQKTKKKNADAKKEVKKDTKKKVVSKKKETIKPVKKDGLFKRISNWFKSVIKEVSKVKWPSKKEMAKYSLVTIVFIVFFALFFYAIELLMALLKSLI